MNRQPFGRRAAQSTCFNEATPPATSSGVAHAQPAVSPGHEALESPSASAADDSVDEELREWKKARRKTVKLPWRQIAFMASVCFGVGSFVLPDSINHAVQWPLLGLAVLGFAAGFSKAR
jgi:hypothetical protein